MELHIYIYHITTKGNDVTCWVEALINPGREREATTKESSVCGAGDEGEAV